MYKLYSMQRSGNSYKVRLALALLNLPYEAIEVDILRGESRTPDEVVPVVRQLVRGVLGVA